MGAVEAYAVALFSVARERGKIEEIGHELQGIYYLLETMGDFDIFLNHPIIPRDVKKNVIKSALAKELSQEMQNFIFLSIDKNMQNSLKEILREYSNLYRKFKGQRYAKVYTVVKLFDDEKATIKKKLDTMFNTDTVIENIVDKTILGGMIVRMGFEVIDGSLRTDLNKIKSTVLQGEYV